MADWLAGCLLGMHTISIFQGQLFVRQSRNSEKGFVCATADIADTADTAAGEHEPQPWPARHTMPCYGATGPWDHEDAALLHSAVLKTFYRP